MTDQDTARLQRAIFGAVLALGLTVCMLPGGAKAQDVFEVKQSEIDDLKAVYATVRSTDEIFARVRTGGTVAALNIKKDSEVKTGDVIAIVTDQKLALRMKSLDAQIFGLQSRAETAKAELQRQEQLAQKGFATSAKLDEARAISEVAANALKSTVAERAVLTQQVQEGDVLAPAQGRVLAIPVTAGSVVMPGEPIAKIAANAFVLRLELPERHARFIQKGDPVIIDSRQLSGPDATLSRGSIVLVYPELQDGRVIADAKAEGARSIFRGRAGACLDLRWQTPNAHCPAYVPIQTLRARLCPALARRRKKHRHRGPAGAARAARRRGRRRSKCSRG